MPLGQTWLASPLQATSGFGDVVARCEWPCIWQLEACLLGSLYLYVIVLALACPLKSHEILGECNVLPGLDPPEVLIHQTTLLTLAV